MEAGPHREFARLAVTGQVAEEVTGTARLATIRPRRTRSGRCTRKDETLARQSHRRNVTQAPGNHYRTLKNRWVFAGLPTLYRRKRPRHEVRHRRQCLRSA